MSPRKRQKRETTCFSTRTFTLDDYNLSNRSAILSCYHSDATGTESLFRKSEELSGKFSVVFCCCCSFFFIWRPFLVMLPRPFILGVVYFVCCCQPLPARTSFFLSHSRGAFLCGGRRKRVSNPSSSQLTSPHDGRLLLFGE